MHILSLNKVRVFAPDSKQRVLVDEVSCDVQSGQVLSIIGPNGAGKSSLLKALTGEWRYQGEIIAEPLSQQQKLRARQVAVLPQMSLLNFSFSVEEVVMLGRIPHQTGARRDQQIVTAALELMDVGFLIGRPYTELSGGEKQRVQLARVLAQIWSADDAENGARLLILDEPTSALDIGHQHALMRAIKSFAEQGVAVISVMHDINLAAQYSDQLLALLCSQVVAHGTPQSVLTQSLMQTLFSVEADVIQRPNSNIPMVVSR